MCNGFGMIVSKDGKGYFTMPNIDGDISHSEILRALGWKEDTDTRLRKFVRVECADWTMKSFNFDEVQTLPGWVDEAEVKTLVANTLKKAAPARAEYEKARASAPAEYNKATASAWAEYYKACAPARAEYYKACASARAEYDEATAQARRQYQEARDAANPCDHYRAHVACPKIQYVRKARK